MTESSFDALSAFLPQLLYEAMASTTTQTIGRNEEIRCDILIVDDNASSQAPNAVKPISNWPRCLATPTSGNKDPRKRLSLSLSPPSFINRERRWKSKARNEKSPRRLSMPSRTSDDKPAIYRQTRSFEDHMLVDSPLSPHFYAVDTKTGKMNRPSRQMKENVRASLRSRVGHLSLELPFSSDLR